MLIFVLFLVFGCYGSIFISDFSSSLSFNKVSYKYSNYDFFFNFDICILMLKLLYFFIVFFGCVL